MIYKSGFPAWKYQVIQTEYNKVIFHYLLCDDGVELSHEMRDCLRSLLWKYLGDNVKIQFVVGDFEVSKSGKHRFVINRILTRRTEKLRWNE